MLLKTQESIKACGLSNFELSNGLLISMLIELQIQINKISMNILANTQVQRMMYYDTSLIIISDYE